MRTQRAGSLTRGLVGAWCPSLGATGFRLQDRSGWNNHGTLTSMASTAWVTSGGKGALSFAPFAYVELGSSQNLRPVRFTYSAWINPSTTANAYSQIMGFDPGASSTQVCTLLIKSNLKLALYVARPGGGSGYDSYDGAGVTLTAGQWYHLAAQHSPAGLRVFVNGVLDGSAAYTADPNVAAGSFWIGGQNGYSNRYFSGFIDDARLYNRALTAPEVRQLYIGGRGFGLIPERPRHRSKVAAAGFKAYWARRQSQLIGGGL